MTPDEVKAFRATKGWSQATLAQQAGVTNQTVEAWEKKGAKGYWRYVFAALAAGLNPWGGRPVGDRIDLALKKSIGYRTPHSDAPFVFKAIELTTADFDQVLVEPAPDGPITLRPSVGNLGAEYRGRRLVDAGPDETGSYVVGHCGQMEIRLPIR